MSDVISLKGFPFDSMEVLNEESGLKEYDREAEAKIYRKYFAKFLSNGVYFGEYNSYKENSMKVLADGGLNIKVKTGAGLINGVDFENETDRVFTLERPVSGNRTDRIIVKLDDTLATRETQLYVKEGTDTTAADLQRDDNIYEICIAEVTVKSSNNIEQADIVDKRANKELCGIVNSLISVDGEELYQKFKDYINTVMEDIAYKSKENIFTKKIIGQGGFEGNVKGNLEGNATTATNANSSNTSNNCSGNSRNSYKIENNEKHKIRWCDIWQCKF